MNFRVGQKVVCVDASAYLYSWHSATDIPRVGTIYTIREIGIDHLGGPGLKLEGMRCVVRWGFDSYGDAFYKASRFRPLVEKKTDAGMAILKSILDEVNAGKHREIVDA